MKGSPVPPDEDASDVYPSTAQQYLEEARQAYDQDGDLEEALRYCDQALKQRPDWAETHNLRGLILDALGRPGEAIESYREAIRQDPFLMDARANLEDAEKERLDRDRSVILEAARKTPDWTKIVLGIAGTALLMILIAGAYGFFKTGWQYFGPKQTLSFEPDHSLLVSAATAAQLQETAAILTERVEQLGYRNIVFTVSQDNEITAEVPGSIDIDLLAERITPIGLVEFVDFGKTGQLDGARVATDVDHPFLQQGEGSIFHTLMTNSEIEWVSVGKDVNGNPQIQFKLTEKGKGLFFEFTSQNIGSYLGIVADKVVISSPYVQSPIPDGQGVISGAFTDQAAEDLVIVLRTRPLPVPVHVK